MAVFWGLLTAVLFGASDFGGGVAAKRERLAVVIGFAHVLGLAAAFVFSLFVAERFAFGDLLIGAGAGLLGGIGLGLLYRRLAIGPMHVVAPLTALTSAGVPALWSIARGDGVDALVAAGLVLGLVAIVLVSLAPADTEQTADLAAVAESLLSGVAFGAMFIVLDTTATDTAPWPIVGARIATAGLLLIFLLAQGQARLASRASLPMIALAGLLDTFGNVTILYGINTDELAIVAVLAGLYPVITVLLAWVVLRDRPTPLQWFGFAVALVATSFIAVG